MTAAAENLLEQILAELRALNETLRGMASLSKPAGSGSRASGSTAGGDEPRFGGYGKCANQPVKGAAIPDLEWYAKGCRRTLDDPGKSKFHARERVLLAAIEAEIAAQRGAPSGGSTDWDGNPVGGEDDIGF